MEEKNNRGYWNSDVQFILTCIGYSVGLGNIWRFPGVAYENGGGAFLFLYMICSLVIGFPVLYFELCLGQFSNSGPSITFGRLFPPLQGIGLGMTVITVMVAVYYNVIVAWVLIYLFSIIAGSSGSWTKCGNSWNTPACLPSFEAMKYKKSGGVFLHINGSRIWKNESVIGGEPASFPKMNNVNPAEEFFENFVLEKTSTVTDLGGINWKVAIALAVAWSITALCAWRGVKWIGRISLVTATLPYLIILVLFIRGITLKGSDVGINYYLLKLDFSRFATISTWKAAATQVCFSLSVGFGVILSLSSYNSFHHNCFRDAVIISLADSFMGVFGGTAVFAVLGFMATELQIEISEVVQNDVGLVFIAYPKAISRMPIPWLWYSLFFSVLLLLGITTQTGITEALCTAICDHFPELAQKRHYVVCSLCASMFTAGLLMCTRAGIFYFTIFNHYSSSCSLMLFIFLELCIICYFYGLKRFIVDVRMMMGQPQSAVSCIFGPSGSCLRVVWYFVAPIATAVMFMCILKEQISKALTYGRGQRSYVLPALANQIGWGMTALALSFIPCLFFFNMYKFWKADKSLREFFRVQPDWYSFSRQHQADNPCCERCSQKVEYKVVAIGDGHRIQPLYDVYEKKIDAWQEHTL